MKLYRIDADGTVAEEPDTMAWSLWMDGKAYARLRRIGYELAGVYQISTVFTGVSPEVKEGERPTPFQTAVFDARSKTSPPLEVDHYASRDEAVAGHKQILRKYQQLEQNRMCDEVREGGMKPR